MPHLFEQCRAEAAVMQPRLNSAEAQPMLRRANIVLSQYIIVYDVAHATGMADRGYMFLTLKGRSSDIKALPT